jgi:3-oxoadipyl-CoA thiolase
MAPAYIVDGCRTPIGRYGGALASVRPDDLAAHVIQTVTSRHPDVDWNEVDDVVMGCANQAGEDNRNVARMAVLIAGLNDQVPGSTINRLCGSGADAVTAAARAIISDQADLIVAGGLESMSRAPFVVSKSPAPYGRNVEMADSTLGWRFIHSQLAARYGTESMGETAENVAEDFDIARADQDRFALRSQQRARAAIESGRFAREVVPVPVPQRRGDPIMVDVDEHPRDVTEDSLARLKPAFRDGGTVTAGNSSGINDGAAALVVASDRAVERYGFQPLARITGSAVAGVPPRIMGIGPVPATQKLLRRTGRKLVDCDLVELNEAFAAQSIAVLDQLGLPTDSDLVNPNGGAIALGHPLGMSGARLALTAAVQMQLEDRRRALVTMCIGVGQGIALLLEAA